MSASTERRGRPRGAGTPPLAEIVAAALAFIDAHGLERFSINALAAEMGAIQPNMYRRISSRSALLDLVVDEIMAEVGVPELDPSDWHAWLADWGVRVRRTWLRHPAAGALIYHGGARSRAAADTVFGVFLRAFPEDFAPVAAKAYLAHVFGATLLETRGAGGDGDRAPEPAEVASLANVLEYARLEEARGDSPQVQEDDFLQGLTILLDGLVPHSTAT